MPVVFLEAGATSWAVPSGVTRVQVECVGAGGSGINTGSRGGGGGGGGAYASRTISVVPGATISCQIGAGGSQSDTWFGSSATVLAKAGANGIVQLGGLDGVGGPGGSAADSVGDVRYSGGDGGDNGTITYGSGNGTRGAGGGGGAAGPRGPGGKGGVGGHAVATTNGAGGGGGGANGGRDGANAPRGEAYGGAGGAGPTGAPGGTIGSVAGVNGSGGAGSLCDGTPYSAGIGSHNAEWAPGYGVGSGGGGGGRGANPRAGARGASFGGGGGGGGGNSTTLGGTGGAGLIVITYSAEARSLSAGAGTLATVSTGASLRRGFVLPAGAAVAAITPSSCDLRLRRRLASHANLGIEGAAVLVRRLVLPVDSRAMALQAGVDLSRSWRMSVAPIAVTLSGLSATPSRSIRIILSAAASPMQATGPSVTMRRNLRLSGGAALALAMPAASIRVTVRFAPPGSSGMVRIAAPKRTARLASITRHVFIRKGSTMDHAWGAKGATSRAKRGFDWSDWLDGGLIVEAWVERLSGTAVVEIDGFDGTRVGVWISGGDPGGMTRVRCTIRTASGESEFATAAIRCG